MRTRFLSIVTLFSIFPAVLLFTASCNKKHEISDSVRNASAKSSIRIIYLTQKEYHQTNGTFGTLEELGKAQFVDPAIASGKKSDHLFTLILSGDQQSYECYAIPFKRKDLTSFLLTSDGIIRGCNKKGIKASLDDPIIDKLKTNRFNSMGVDNPDITLSN